MARTAAAGEVNSDIPRFLTRDSGDKFRGVKKRLQTAQIE
jgi:hypothetical protein